MPDFDNSINIVGIIAVVALLSPPITALVESIAKIIFKIIDYKRSFYENEYNHKRELFENFLDCSGRVMYDREGNIEELSHAYYTLVPYIPSKELVYFREYCNLIQEDNVDDIEERASKLLNEKIVPCIKKELRRRKPLRR